MEVTLELMTQKEGKSYELNLLRCSSIYNLDHFDDT